MVDLKGQYDKISQEIDTAISGVINSSAFINGPDVKTFENNLAAYLNVKYAIGCGNGTDALQAALMALGLKPGDEVITTTFTFVSTAETIALLGLKPVLVDTEPDTFNMCPRQTEKAITSRTRAIMPVHLYGQCCNMDFLSGLAVKYNLNIIEDAAQALGADYTFADGQVKKAGAIGHIGCTSFFPTKNLGCFGDGGALFTNNAELAEKIRMIVNHGMKVKYRQETIGVNSRLDSIQAAILNIKLKYLDVYNDSRRKAAEYYDNAFRDNPKIIIPSRTRQSSHIFHQYTLKTTGIDRDELKRFLASRQIPSMIYYPVPVHLQNAYRYLGHKEGDFPVSERLCKTVLSLPMHTELSDKQLEYITDNVTEYTK